MFSPFLLFLFLFIGGDVHGIPNPEGSSSLESEAEPVAQKCQDFCSSISKEDVKIVDYLTVGISDDSYLELMSASSGVIREDLPIPDSALGRNLRAEFDNGVELICTVVQVCGKEWVITYRHDKRIGKGN